MVALIVAPAATMRLLTDRVSTMLWGGAVLGVIGAVGGVALAFALNQSGAACVALVLGAAFLAAFIFAPGHGLLARWRVPDHWCEESFRRWHRPFASAPSAAAAPIHSQSAALDRASEPAASVK
jgi:drug/metabolite transporter (DMT)-like permease